MSTAAIPYDAKLSPLADGDPIGVLPAAFKAVVLEETVTATAALAAVRARLSEWAQSLPHHPYQDFGDRVKLLRVQQCHSYRMSFATHLDERALKVIKNPCRDKPGASATHTKASLDMWRFALPVGQLFTAADFPDRMVANSRTVTICDGCDGARRVTCDECAGARKFRCSPCQGGGRVTCGSCNGNGQRSCGGCSGQGRLACASCFGRGRQQFGFGQNAVSQICGYCAGSGRRSCSACRAAGRVTCTSCSGSGRRTCSPCHGRGEITCGECSGGGEINCRCCKGHGAFEEFVALQRKLLANARTAFVAHPRVAAAPAPSRASGDPPPLPGKPACPAWLAEAPGALIATASGGQIPATVGTALPLQTAGQAAQGLIAKELRAKDAKAQRILQQRLQVQRITSLEVRYEFGGRPYVIWLHGPEAVPAAERLPAALTLGRSMLERTQHILGGRVYSAANVPEGKLRAAQRTYALTLDPHRERVLCLLDDSFIGSGAKGFVLTDQYLYFRNLVTGQPFRVALTDLRSIIPEFNDAARTVAMVNGSADLRMKRLTAVQRANVIALLSEIADSVHEDVYEPPGDTGIDDARLPSGEEQLDAVIFVLIQTALWDLAGVSRQEVALLAKQVGTWAGLFSVSLTRIEVEDKLNEAGQRAHEDATGGTTRQLDHAISVLTRSLKSETRARLFADLDAVASLQNGAAAGQKEFLAWLGQVLPAQVSDKAPGGQEQLEAVAYLLLQAALWDLNGVSKPELAQLVKCLRGWAAVLALPLRTVDAEEMLNRASRRAQEDADQGATRWLDQSLAALRKALTQDTHAQLLTDLNAIAGRSGALAEGQQRFLTRVVSELPAPTA